MCRCSGAIRRAGSKKDVDTWKGGREPISVQQIRGLWSYHQ